MVLRRHPSVLASVAGAGLLVVLAASSGPLVTTAAASSALKDELVELTPFATGLQISGAERATGSAAATSIRAAETRERAARELGRRLGLEPPVFTVETGLPVTLPTGSGDVPLNLLARTGVLKHVRILARTAGPGVWISDFTARIARVRPGEKLRLSFAAEPGSKPRTVALRVKGIYRALDATTPGPYWAHFLREIFPPGVDPPPPVRYVLMGQDQLYRVIHRLGGYRIVKLRGQAYQFGSGPPALTMAEFAVDPHGLTITRARSLSQSFSRVRHELRGSSLGRSLGCVSPRPAATTAVGTPPPCRVASSLASAVAIADRNVSEISPVVKLLSGAAAAIALAFATAAGVFLVKRRAAEAALLYARGERPASFAARTGLELVLPLLIGAAVGLGLAAAATALLAPAGSVDHGTLESAARNGVLAALAALVLAAMGATVAFVGQFDSGAPRRAWLRKVPWELPLFAVAGWLLYDLHSGGGLAGQSNGAGHPTLAVFVFPLLLVAATAGLVLRALRRLLRVGSRRSAAMPIPVLFAVRRLVAAGPVLTALVVVTAVAFGSFLYAEALASSLSTSVAEKGYVSYGGDAQGVVSTSAPLPRAFSYPLTKLDFANQAAVVGGENGTYADVLSVDAGTLGSVLHWYPGWGSDPRPLFPELARPAEGRLPVVVTDAIPAATNAIWVQGTRIPVRVIARVHVFPGMTTDAPLIVTDTGALAAAARKAGIYDPLNDPATYVWAKGPPAAAAQALEAPPITAAYVSSVDAFRKQPDVVAATRAFSYMRLMAIASGVLVFLGLILYLGARQRSQAVASTLAARMHLRRRTEVVSLVLELTTITLVAALIGAIVALAAADPVIRHLDPLPDYQPGPTLTVPLTALVTSLAGLLVIAIVAAVFTSWTARRTNMAEALRVI